MYTYKEYDEGCQRSSRVRGDREVDVISQPGVDHSVPTAVVYRETGCYPPMLKGKKRFYFKGLF